MLSGAILPLLHKILKRNKVDRSLHGRRQSGGTKGVGKLERGRRERGTER